LGREDTTEKINVRERERGRERERRERENMCVIIYME